MSIPRHQKPNSLCGLTKWLLFNLFFYHTIKCLTSSPLFSALIFLFCLILPNILIFLFRWWQVPYYWAGVKAYDFVAGFQLLKPSFLLSYSKALEQFPMLNRDKLKAALVYYDGMLKSLILFLLLTNFVGWGLHFYFNLWSSNSLMLIFLFCFFSFLQIPIS